MYAPRDHIALRQERVRKHFLTVQLGFAHSFARGMSTHLDSLGRGGSLWFCGKRGVGGQLCLGLLGERRFLNLSPVPVRLLHGHEQKAWCMRRFC